MPLISPVDTSKFNPAGRLGVIVQEIIVPGPVEVGVIGKSLLAVLLVNVKLEIVMLIVGTTSFTSIEIVVESLPPALVAVIV